MLISESPPRISVPSCCSTGSVWTCCWTCNMGLKLLVLFCWSPSVPQVHLFQFCFCCTMTDKLRTLFSRTWLFCFPPPSFQFEFIHEQRSIYLFLSKCCCQVWAAFFPVFEEFMRDHIHFTFARLTCLLNFSWEIHSPIHLLLSCSVSPALVWSFSISDAFVLSFILGGNSTFYRDIIFPEMPFSRNIFMALSCWGLIIQLQSVALLRLLSFLWVNVYQTSYHCRNLLSNLISPPLLHFWKSSGGIFTSHLIFLCCHIILILPPTMVPLVCLSRVCP